MNEIRMWIISKLIGKCAVLANVDIQGCYLCVPQQVAKDLLTLQNKDSLNNCKKPKLILVNKVAISLCIIDGNSKKDNIKIRPTKGYKDKVCKGKK